MKRLILIIMILLFTGSALGVGGPGVVKDPKPDPPTNVRIEMK